MFFLLLLNKFFDPKEMEWGNYTHIFLFLFLVTIEFANLKINESKDLFLTELVSSQI